MLIKLWNFLVLLAFFCLKCHGVTENGWLRACDKGENYEIQAPVCSKGIWLSEPKALDCICAKGVWILSNDFCDKGWTLVVGNGHCFQILDKVRSIKFIGKPDEPFASSTFTGPMDLADLNQISGGSYSNHLHSDVSVVIGINPKYPVQRIDKSVCLGKGNGSRPVHIYRNSHEKFNQWRTLYNRECSTLDYEFHLDLGELYRDATVVPADIAVGKCKEMCSSTGKSLNNVRKGRHIGSRSNMSVPTPLMPEMTETGKARGRSAFANVVELKPPFDVKPGSPEEKKLECLTNRAQVTQDPKQYEIETKEQTIRMIGAHLKPLVLNVTSFEVHTKEYQYFNYTKRIFSKTCPGLTAAITNAIMKMWGLLVWESHDKFTHMESPDEELHTRILDLLTKCDKSAITIKENKVPYNDTFCPMQTISGMSTHYNGTENFVVMDTLPDYLKFDPKKHDLVIETAWKMVMVMYYRCGNTYSKQNQAVELSYLMAKLQSFFNEKIIKRWTDSKDSWSIYSFILFGYSLEAFSESVDRCLGFSKELAEVSNWLLRPKMPCSDIDLTSSRGKRSIESWNKAQKTVWNSNGYCIKDFLDPVTKFNHWPRKECSIQRKMN